MTSNSASPLTTRKDKGKQTTNKRIYIELFGDDSEEGEDARMSEDRTIANITWKDIRQKKWEETKRAKTDAESYFNSNNNSNNNSSSSSSSSSSKYIDTPATVASSPSTTIARYRHRSVPQMGIVRNLHTFQLVDFLLDNLPSSWSHELLNVHWVYVSRRANVTSSANSTCVGKWMWFVPASEVDEKSVLVAGALEQGLLGCSFKVPPVSCPQKGSNTYTNTNTNTNTNTIRERYVPLIIYTEDFKDRNDVLRVGRSIQDLGAGLLSYKPDVFTGSEDGIHGSDKLPKTIYTLKKGANKLSLTDNGRAYDVALSMV